jgi:uncharacterized protein
MSANAPRSQALWLLVIIHLSGRVDGITRLHKMAFLTAQLALDSARVGFYTDWVPSKYGPFSPSLAGDVQVLIDQGDVRKDVEQLSPNAHMEKFSLTPLGEHFASTIERDHPKETDAIRKMIVAKYAKAPLMSLLHDVYYLFPQFTTESKIAGEIFDIGKRSKPYQDQ